jgi:predicted branched-subunit amino acid permease
MDKLKKYTPWALAFILGFIAGGIIDPADRLGLSFQCSAGLCGIVRQSDF